MVGIAIVASMFIWPRQWAEWVFALVAGTVGGIYIAHGHGIPMFMGSFLAFYIGIMLVFWLIKQLQLRPARVRVSTANDNGRAR